MKSLLTLSVLGLVAASVSGCATISKNECAVGNWGDRGYRDGTNGSSRSLLADYADDCAKHGYSVDRAAYLSSYETGLTYYCNYDNGFSRGEGGSGFNPVCSGDLATEFRKGYNDGREIYLIASEHRRLISDLEETMAELADIRDALRDPDLLPSDEERLLRERDILEDSRVDQRYDLRAFERENGLPPADI